MVSLAVAKSNGDYIYAGNIRGVWRSTNGGTTYTDVTGNMTVEREVIDFAIDPSDPNHVIALQPTSAAIARMVTAE
jgi:hypothetical protein